MKILILAYMHKCATAAVRSLARAGHEVDMAVPIPPNRSRVPVRFVSRYAGKAIELPDPVVETEAYRARVLELVKGGAYDALLPFGNAEAALASQMRDELRKHVGLAVPDYETFETVHDKRNLHLTLALLGFDLPRMYAYEHPDQFRDMDIEYPVVLKARRNSGVFRGVRYAADVEELEIAYAEMTKRSSTNTDIVDYAQPMIQEFIPGDIHDGLFLFKEGSLRAAMSTMRVETFPLSGGVCVTARTTDQPKLLEWGSKILGALEWHGPCELEAKKDPRDGRFKLLEINPRFWGQLDLATQAGLDFALKTAEIAAHGDTAEQYDYDRNLHYKFLFPLEFFSMYQDKGQRLARIGRLKDVLRSDTRCEVDIRDLKPNLLDVMQTAHGLLLKRKDLRKLDAVGRAVPTGNRKLET